MRVKHLAAALSVSVALAGANAVHASTYEDGTYRWSFYMDETEAGTEYASIHSVRRLDGADISGALIVPEAVTLVATNVTAT